MENKNINQAATENALPMLPMDGIAPAVQEKLGALKSPMLRNDLVLYAQLEAEGQHDRKRVLMAQAGIMVHMEDSKAYKAAGFKSRAQAMEETLGVKSAQASRDIKAWRIFGDVAKRADVDTYLFEHTNSWDALRDMADMTLSERTKLAQACGFLTNSDMKMLSDLAEKAKQEGAPLPKMPVPEERNISWDMAREAKKAAQAARPPEERSGRAVSTKPYRVMTYSVDWNTAKVTSTPVTRQRLETPKNTKGDFGATTIIDGKAFTVAVTPKGFSVTVAVPEQETPKESKDKPKESPRAKAIAALVALGYTKEDASALADAKLAKGENKDK